MKYRFDQIAFNSTAKKSPTEADKEHYIGLEHIDSQCLEITRWGSEVAPIGDKLIMKKGDVLFGKRRAYQRKLAISPFDGIFSAHGMVLRPKEDVVDKDFFPFFMSSDIFMERAVQISVGGLSPTINWKDLREQEFDLPPLEEQKVLAEKLWAAYRLKQAYKRLLVATEDMVKSQFIEMFGNPGTNDKGWEVVEMKTACLYISDGSHYSPPADATSSIPMLSVKDMTNHGFLYSNCKHLSRNEYEKLCANGCKPLKDDVLVAKDGSYFKYIFPLEEEIEQAILSSIAILRPNQEKITPRFLCEYLKNKDVLDIVERNYLTGTAIRRVILKGFKDIQIYLPPLSLQIEFETIYNQSDKSGFELRKSIEAIDAVIKSLINN